jgi:hypothetical protein
MRHVGWVIASIVLAVGATGAGATVTPNVRGTLVRGPVTPVCVVEVPCDRPAPGVTLVFSRPGGEAVPVMTGKGGNFAVRLSPGRYDIRTLRRVRLGSGLVPSVVRVPREGVVRLRLHLDTGIR